MLSNVANFWSRVDDNGQIGLVLYTIVLFAAIGLLPSSAIDPSAHLFIAGIGILAVWRYSWGAVHFLRSLIYRHKVFPRLRAQAEASSGELMPSKIYVLMTLYRIDPHISSRSIRSVLEEAISSTVPVTIVASIVEKQDEFVFKSIAASYELPEHVQIKLCRLPGKGKRVGLSHGFKTISRDIPPDDAVVVVMDGDTVLLPDTLRRSVPFFKMNPRLGALTTDEIAEMESGTKAMEEWHELRFAQRQILMSSISLSRRVMTLTGRMSIFRADIVTDPDFIRHITEDHLEHWRLGNFKFLTGDDKSSLYWVMQRGYEQLYLPDVKVLTLEDPPADNLFRAATLLMFRWYGNMFRTNARIIKLGADRLPFFVWWSFIDQRLSMWTTLAGPVFATMLAFKYGMIFYLYYFVWVAFVRWVMTLMLLSARKKTSWRYPFLLYFSQVYGALIKSWVSFRLDRQSWTRQKTKLNRGLSRREAIWNEWSSHLTHATAVLALVCAIGFASHAMDIPHSTLRALSNGAYTEISAPR